VEVRRIKLESGASFETAAADLLRHSFEL